MSILFSQEEGSSSSLVQLHFSPVVEQDFLNSSPLKMNFTLNSIKDNITTIKIMIKVYINSFIMLSLRYINQYI